MAKQIFPILHKFNRFILCTIYKLSSVTTIAIKTCKVQDDMTLIIVKRLEEN